MSIIICSWFLKNVNPLIFKYQLQTKAFDTIKHCATCFLFQILKIFLNGELFYV